MKALVIGCGNAMRRDDGVGRVVARGLVALGGTAAEASGEATALMALFEGRQAVVVVDACASGAAPGFIREFDAVAAPLPAGLSGLSSHGFGVAEAVELARALGALPERLTVFAVEGADFSNGEGLSPEVAAAADRLIRRLGGG